MHYGLATEYANKDAVPAEI
uniref:Uncharacterized protein n=1 Tax=Arundo donax TaxID=35708 RepID=A0A0A8ZFI9_ARUDO